MWQKQHKGFFKEYHKKFVYALIGLCIGSLLLIGCGAGSATTASNTPAHMSNASGNTDAQLAQKAGQVTAANNSGAAGTPSAQAGPQYLQKSLQVTLDVQDTRE